MKVLEITKAGAKWHVPVEEIAENRAKYYVGRDADTTYEEEFDYVMNNRHEAIDWYFNNMDPEVASMLLIKTPKIEEWPADFDYQVKDVEYGPDDWTPWQLAEKLPEGHNWQNHLKYQYTWLPCAKVVAYRQKLGVK